MEISEALAPEDAKPAVPSPGVQRGTGRFGPRALGDLPGPFECLEMLRNGVLSHAAPPHQRDHGDLVGTNDPLENFVTQPYPTGWPLLAQYRSAEYALRFPLLRYTGPPRHSFKMAKMTRRRHENDGRA